jgi:hypothetical protein
MHANAMPIGILILFEIENKESGFTLHGFDKLTMSGAGVSVAFSTELIEVSP